VRSFTRSGKLSQQHSKSKEPFILEQFRFGTVHPIRDPDAFLKPLGPYYAFILCEIQTTIWFEECFYFAAGNPRVAGWGSPSREADKDEGETRGRA
jgi:hypothetical protein